MLNTQIKVSTVERRNNCQEMKSAIRKRREYKNRHEK